MNDNGRPNDPLSAAQFLVPAISNITISQLSSARVNGEFFPNIAGDFLRVAACDLPARISFNNTDVEQSIPVRNGMIVRGKFSGITLWHDAYGSFSSVKPKIVLNLSRGSKLDIDNTGGSTGQSLPFFTNSFTTTLFEGDIPLPLGYNNILIKASVQVGNIGAPLVAMIKFFFFDRNNIVIDPTVLVRNAKGYVTFNSSQYSRAVAAQNYGANLWVYDIPETVLSFPTNAEFCRVQCAYAATSFQSALIYAAAR